MLYYVLKYNQHEALTHQNKFTTTTLWTYLYKSQLSIFVAHLYPSQIEDIHVCSPFIISVAFSCDYKCIILGYYLLSNDHFTFYAFLILIPCMFLNYSDYLITFVQKLIRGTFSRLIIKNIFIRVFICFYLLYSRSS